MNFNGVTEYLLRWCVEKREEYFRRNLQERADTGRSLLFVKRFFFDEMTYKVLYLVDRDFSDFGAYQAAVRELIPLRKSYVLEHEKDPEALALLLKAEQECRDYVNRLRETDWAPSKCYCRAVFGEERERLEYAILEKWNYRAEYWYPLVGSPVGETLFLNVEYLEPYWDRLCALTGLPEARLYEYGESCYEDGQILEVDVMESYGGTECVYLPRDLSWIIYFSHEDTVTFAGSILGAVKELLADEREHWNKWE